jgi:molecular chaperone GrpE
MSEPPPPAVPANPSDDAAALTGQEQAAGSPVPPSPGLDPDLLAGVLKDFEDWLSALPAGLQASPPAQIREPVDLHTLVGNFVALRHAVNLQTKAVRAQQELNSETLRQLTLAMDALEDQNRKSVPAPVEDPDESHRAALKTLIDLYDALSLAAREVQRVQEAVMPVVRQVTEPGPATEEDLPTSAAPPPRSRWARWLGLKGRDTDSVRALDAPLAAQQMRQREEQARQSEMLRTAGERIRQMLSSVIMGYTMSLQRLDRALEQQGLEAIPCVGTVCDPELMEVLEVVHGTGRPSGEVLEEVRRGYRWNGRVFRFAQVRVARS